MFALLVSCKEADGAYVQLSPAEVGCCSSVGCVNAMQEAEEAARPHIESTVAPAVVSYESLVRLGDWFTGARDAHYLELSDALQPTSAGDSCTYAPSASLHETNSANIV